MRKVTVEPGGVFGPIRDHKRKASLRDTLRASLLTLPARAWLAPGTVPG